ncbi:hypothetical protein [Nocardia beijingensis]|uniref:hypothetical protein n=1 Tax=Nocardia beijingensis TaxID=95162 RepID=UPI000AF41F47|nr:hypothetical protein [Nocardia beijingensis]
MGATKSIDELNAVLDQFADKVEEIRNQPAKVDEAFDKAAIAVASLEGAAVGIPFLLIPITGAVGAAYGAITNDDFTGYMQDHKEGIKDKIRELLEKLHDAIEGLRAPIAFLQAGEEWLKLKSTIGDAQNNEVARGSILGYWQGGAAIRYGTTRALQDTALDSAKAACEKISDCLAAISDSAWDFYSSIVQDIVGFLAKFSSALGKISLIFESPWGISDAIDALGEILVKTVAYGDRLVDALLTQRNNIKKMTDSIQNPKGFLNNRWPQSASNDFDINSPGAGWAAI